MWPCLLPAVTAAVAKQLYGIHDKVAEQELPPKKSADPVRLWSNIVRAAAMFVSRHVHIVYGVKCQFDPAYFSVPVFFGGPPGNFCGIGKILVPMVQIVTHTFCRRGEPAGVFITGTGAAGRKTVVGDEKVQPHPVFRIFRQVLRFAGVPATFIDCHVALWGTLLCTGTVMVNPARVRLQGLRCRPGTIQA